MIDNLFRWMIGEIDVMTTIDHLRYAQNVIKEHIFCPHLPDAGCACRKPKPGMIYYLAVKWGIDLKKSWMIGDSVSDMKAGWNAGIRRLLKIDETAPPLSDTVTRMFNRADGIQLRNILDAARFIKDSDKR